MQIVKLKIKSCAPHARGWQVNATVNGRESEITFYEGTKAQAEEKAIKIIERRGELPNEPYKGVS